MIAETAGLLSSFKALYEITNAMLGIRNSIEMNTKISELQGAIIIAQQQAIAIQQSYFTLDAKTRDLEAECMRLKDWSAEKQKYTTREVAPGVFAYLQDEHVENFQEAHKLCCNCFEDGQRSILQQVMHPLGNHITLICARCDFKTTFDRYIKPSHAIMSSR